MKHEKPKNFKFCEISLYLAYKSLTEIGNILYHKSNDSSPLAKSDTFRFYLFTLHYTFILEITKLLEKYDNTRTNDFASLERLNKKLLNMQGKSYQELFDKNLDLIKEIWNSEIYQKILLMRNSKIAHIDNKNRIKPFSFEMFTNEDLENLHIIIEKVKILLNNCLSVYSTEYFLPSFSRTTNLLTFFEEYRAFAHSSPIEFWKWKNTNKLNKK